MTVAGLSLFNDRRRMTGLLSADAFDRVGATLGSTDGTGLDDPTPWTSRVGDPFSTNGSEAVLTSGAPDHNVETVSLGVADVDLSVDPFPTGLGASAAGLCFRYSDASNYWFAITTPAATFDLVKRVATVETVVASVPTLAGRIRVVCVGSAIAGYQEKSTVPDWTTTDAFNATAVLHGLFGTSPGGANTGFDNWLAFDPARF